MKKIIIASNNVDKIKEIRCIFGDNLFCFLTLKDIGFEQKILEDQNSFQGNALKKASLIMNVTKQLTLADDSGLEVDILNGQPGVYSARFSGTNATDEENNKKLLKLMEGVPMNERRAQFRCVVAVVSPDGRSFIAEGVCPGKIGDKARGNNGFGYDPIFIPQGFNRTFAELEDHEKNKISHRSIALKNLKDIMLREKFI
jgi:XTP/dITP diphosphohydrolase